MWDQEFFLAIEQGQNTPKFTGRECVLGSRLFARCLNKGRTQPASVQGHNVGSGVFVRDLNKGRSQPGSVRGPRCRFRSVCRVIEQGQDPPYLSAWTEMCPQECFLRFEHGKDADCFRSETEMWTQEDVFGCLTRAGSRLVQCSDRAVGAAAFAGGFSKCLTQPRPVQGMRCWLGGV